MASSPISCWWLPSRPAGDTCGLVVNMAMRAGFPVVVSNAVDCVADFFPWERFRTIPVGSAQHLIQALEDLATYPRSFDWASSASRALAASIAELT